MKLKPDKEKITISTVLKEMFSRIDLSSSTAVSIDINGGVTLENFRKIIDYQNNKITIETKQKIVYIYGENLTIASCNIHSATAEGIINKIEFFTKEV